jgi:hypothetical protein
MPPNPKIAATSAMIKKTTAQPNIYSPPRRRIGFADWLACLCDLWFASDTWTGVNDLPLPKTSLRRELH